MSGEWDVVQYAVTGSFLAGMATGIGALLVFFIRTFTERVEVLLLSIAAGIMLAASFFSLLQPGIELAAGMMASKMLGVAIVVSGLVIGALALFTVHRAVPHVHLFVGHDGADAQRLGRIWLFVLAVALHNFPEGMAVGVGFVGGDISNGISLAVGIGIQNIPEGLAVAAALMVVNYSRMQAFAVAFATGLIEPVGGLFGSAAVWLAEPLLPWTLGFAGGAMLFIISDEIIPETHRNRSRFTDLATFSLLGGFAVMMFLDAALG